MGDDLSTRTRHNIKSQDEADVDNVGALEMGYDLNFAINKVPSLSCCRLKISNSWILFVQNVNKYP